VTIRVADPGAYNCQLHDELDHAFRRVVAGGRYILGPELEAFEREFAAYVEADHCVGVGNGYDALVLGLRSLDIGPGDEVLVPTNTYVATWLAVSAVGAIPIGVEPDESTFLLDPGRLETALSPRTRAVVPVHLYGHPADMDAISTWAADHGVVVLADAAQAHGARHRGYGLGSLGNAVAWSFYPTKNLGALGDGGAVTSNDPDLVRRVRLLRNTGSLSGGQVEVHGANSRLDELQAAMLRVKLRSLDDWNAGRRSQAVRYQKGLADLEVRLPAAATTATAVWHLYVVRCADRDRVRAHLAEGGVETLVHYPVPPFDQPAYGELKTRQTTFPIARRLAAEVLSLPIGLHLSETEQDRVIQLLWEVLRRPTRQRTSARR